jgi:hypothetical protein
MGAGASFAKVFPKEEKRPYHREDEDEYEYPRRHSNRIHNNNNSTRSAKTLNSMNTTRSVRAMALLNHSRHENSYIAADEISVHLKQQQQKRSENSHHVRDHSNRIEEAPNESDPSEKRPEHTRTKSELTSDENEHLQTHVSAKSLRTFRTNFNLKLNLADEADWNQVRPSNSLVP